MRLRVLAPIVAILFLGAGLLAQSANPPRTKAQRAAKVKVLRHAADTEVIADEMILAKDGLGRTRMTMNGPLPKNGRQRLFWLVDQSTGEYRILRLTNNHQADAQRIARIYRKLGVDLPASYIAQLLLPETEQLKDALQKRDEKLQQRVALRQGARPTPMGLPNPAGLVRAVFNGAGQRRPMVLSDSASESCPEGEKASASLRPAVYRGKGGTVRPAQWVQYCHGTAWADVQTWEPARYLFNVDHLNETYAEGEWYASNGDLNQATGSGWCWANPETFANTHWFLEGCYTSSTVGTSYFDFARTGFYRNNDFIQYFFSCSCPGEWVGVVSTAAVQYVNGGPNWGVDYYENGTPLASHWPQWFFSGITDGGGSQNCNDLCMPEQWQISECEAQSTPEFQFWWDYQNCQCTSNGTPIIIDLNRDGLSLTDPLDGVHFDLMANGSPVRVAWTRHGRDDAFLVLDQNGNGTIDDGTELFGGVTPQPGVTSQSTRTKGKKNSKKDDGPNGFLALRVFDDPANGGNRDSLISDEDRIYSSLRLWTDANHNGVSEPAELTSLSAAGLRSISLRYVSGKKTDEFGNIYRYWSYAIADNDLEDPRPLRRRVVDVLLRFVPAGSVPGPTTTSTSSVRVL